MAIFSKKEEDGHVLSAPVDDISDDEKFNPNNRNPGFIDSSSDAESGKPKERHPFYGGEDHIFKDPAIVDHYKKIYEGATYEGRNHFDPDFTWSRKFSFLNMRCSSLTPF